MHTIKNKHHFSKQHKHNEQVILDLFLFAARKLKEKFSLT